MTARTASAFALPDHLSAKANPHLIAADEAHFAAIAHTLAVTVAELTERLELARRRTAGAGRRALDRDQEVHRLTARLRALQRFGLDLCLGRIVLEDSPEPVYVGRLGLTDDTGRRLLVDWRTPAAEPFFGATHGNPMGLSSRRRYRWRRGQIEDYWDEVFTTESIEGHAALDEQSAFIASLGTSRSARMRDVLGTIQADQDAIIRAGSRTPLVVDGGPGTGKTVVALHRAAYLVYADPMVGHHRGRVLFVGPHQPYLSYVADVLPSLGEEGVQTCTLRDLVPEGADATTELDQRVAQLKSSAHLVGAIEAAVALYEDPPTQRVMVETPWGEATITRRDWAAAFDAPDPGPPHNEAREAIWSELAQLLAAEFEDDDDATDDDQLRAVLQQDEQVAAVLNRAWPLVDAADLVGDLWTVPAYLRRCAPWLPDDDVRALQRDIPDAWTTSDLPFLDAARGRLGDPKVERRERQRSAVIAAERERMSAVIDDILTAGGDDAYWVPMLRGQDLQRALVDEDALPTPEPDLLAGPFVHVVVDEAQELTDAQWQMVLRRCPSRSLTIVGDRAQARDGFAESWAERLHRVGLPEIDQATLRINYRTPEEVMAEAEPVIRAALPDANVPTSVRSTGVPVRHGRRAELTAVIDDWLEEHREGVACVIGDSSYEPRPRVRSLTPALAKGLEFDLVVVVTPQEWGQGVAGAVDRYVAMTRATQQLVVLT